MQSMERNLLNAVCEIEEDLIWSNPETSALHIEIELAAKRNLIETSPSLWGA